MGESSTVVWREDFDHGSLNEMTSAGWTIGNAAGNLTGRRAGLTWFIYIEWRKHRFRWVADGIVDRLRKPMQLDRQLGWKSNGECRDHYPFLRMVDGYYGEFVFCVTASK